jgi:uncharacterized membrane protein (DUF4010 family)
MVVLISGISLAGYTALHVVGTRYGAPLLGLLGGLVSSTATTLLYAKHGKSDQAMTYLVASVIAIASIVVVVRLFVISASSLMARCPVCCRCFRAASGLALPSRCITGAR